MCCSELLGELLDLDPRIDLCNQIAQPQDGDRDEDDLLVDRNVAVDLDDQHDRNTNRHHHERKQRRIFEAGGLHLRTLSRYFLTLVVHLVVSCIDANELCVAQSIQSTLRLECTKRNFDP